VTKEKTIWLDNAEWIDVTCTNCFNGYIPGELQLAGFPLILIPL